ncbi:MAG: F0F1 ATP synthase subunit A [Syntrophorhabdales bacterium]|jgi:F-type H+-transporting ATPase subunit a
MEHEQFSWAGLIPGLSSLPAHVSNSIIVSVVLLVIVILGFVQSQKRKDDIVPDDRLTFRNLLEIVVETISGLVEETMGPRGKEFMLIIGTLGLFILFNNLSGLVPGFVPATDNVNTTFACSLTVFVMTHYYGIREHGMKYVRHFMGPVWWLVPMMIPIEVIGHLSRPLSLGMRLFGNIMGDHLVTGIFFMLIPLFVPLIGMFLGTFVALVQTFVFMLLSMAYFSGAVAHEEL